MFVAPEKGDHSSRVKGILGQMRGTLESCILITFLSSLLSCVPSERVTHHGMLINPPDYRWVLPNDTNIPPERIKNGQTNSRDAPHEKAAGGDR